MRPLERYGDTNTDTVDGGGPVRREVGRVAGDEGGGVGEPVPQGQGARIAHSEIPRPR